MDGAKNDVFEGKKIKDGSKYVDRDVNVHQQEQKITPRLINLDQYPTQQYRKVYNATANESDMKTNYIEWANGAEIVSNASTSVKLVATLSDNREKRDAPLMLGSCLWTLSFFISLLLGACNVHSSAKPAYNSKQN